MCAGKLAQQAWALGQFRSTSRTDRHRGAASSAVPGACDGQKLGEVVVGAADLGDCELGAVRRHAEDIVRVLQQDLRLRHDPRRGRRRSSPPLLEPTEQARARNRVAPSSH